MTKIYYTTENGALDITSQIVPAPFVSIKTNLNYASETNNSLIGYSYTVNLDGNAMAYHSGLNTGDHSIERVVDSIERLRSILALQGGCLYIKDDLDNNLIVAKGGKINSLNFNNSNNNWTIYAPYTAEIEFQEIEFVGSGLSCNQNFLDSASLSANLVDITKYKIKEFSENWSFDFADEIYNRIKVIDTNSNLDIENINFNITYTIDAIGRNYYVNNQLIPAWQQAKDFVQDRLYKQATNLIGRILNISGNEACSAINNLNNSYTIPVSQSGLLHSLHTSTYKIYNETITCKVSESKGSFSATYNCVAKRNKANSYSHPNTIHTFSKRLNYQRENRKTNVLYLEGSIRGLIEGGLIYNNTGSFNLPNSGALIIAGSQTGNKYDSAYSGLSLLFNDNFLDLRDGFKNLLGINNSALGISGSFDTCSEPAGTPSPSVVNLTNNYHDGIINYNLEYSSEKNCGQEIANVSISVQKPVVKYATFIIPMSDGVSEGNIYQDLGTSTAKTISISVQGRNDMYKLCCYNNNSSMSTIFNTLNLCAGILLPPSISGSLPDEAQYILTEKSKEINTSDGSYNISLKYICNPGCDL